MIEQLFNLKKTQTDQRLMQKGQLLSKIERVEAEILITKTQMDTATVQKIGAISDFAVLQMHKNTMRLHITKLETEKNNKPVIITIKGVIMAAGSQPRNLTILEPRITKNNVSKPV